MTPVGAQIPSATVTTAFDAGRYATFEAKLIDDERQWRLPPLGFGPSSSARVIATRWRSFEHRAREVRAETRANSHVVAIVLPNENVLFSVSGRTVLDGVASLGSLHVTQPAAPMGCLFRGQYDVLHLHVPKEGGLS